jgi:hypothetical protein
MSLRQAAAAIGIDKGALWRFEHGLNVDGMVLVKIINWFLQEDPKTGSPRRVL